MCLFPKTDEEDEDEDEEHGSNSNNNSADNNDNDRNQTETEGNDPSIPPEEVETDMQIAWEALEVCVCLLSIIPK